MKTVKAIIQLRRDNDYNFEPIKNTFIPANGEVIFVDTAGTGLRVKVGDGQTTFANLDYIDKDTRDSIVQGYYYDNHFYEDSSKTQLLPANINKIYIDIGSSKIYYFTGANYETIDSTLSTATAYVPGVVKLYNEKGNNTDGTMTQKSITNELNKKYSVSVDKDDNELLIFSIN